MRIPRHKPFEDVPTYVPIRKRSPDRRSEEAQERRRFYWRRSWRRFRRQVLSRYPWCQDCQDAGKYTVATEVHHIAKLSDSPEQALKWSNVSSLCRPCHSRRTAKGE